MQPWAPREQVQRQVLLEHSQWWVAVLIRLESVHYTVYVQELGIPSTANIVSIAPPGRLVRTSAGAPRVRRVVRVRVLVFIWREEVLNGKLSMQVVK